jgi:hypothetical protein
MSAPLAGALVGATGVGYILVTHSNPPPALLYHVPLAFVFGTFAWEIAFQVPPTSRRLRGAATLLALVVVVGRVAGDWPLSGHAVLGATVGLLAPSPWLRALGAAVVGQSWLVKFLGAGDPWSALTGALAGAFLGLLALLGERRAS